MKRHYDVDTSQATREEQPQLREVAVLELGAALEELGKLGNVRLSVIDPDTVLVTCDRCQTRVQLERRSSAYRDQLAHVTTHLKECR